MPTRWNRERIAGVNLWSVRFLRPWLFRRWERERRRRLEGAGRPLPAGAAPPGFTLADESGRMRGSSEWIGVGGAIVWFTNLCAVCADQAADLERFREEGRLAASVVAIHLPGGNAPSVADFRRRTGATFPILIDDGAVGRTWTGESVPDT